MIDVVNIISELNPSKIVRGGGVLHHTDSNQEYIKKGRKLSYLCTDILREVGNIKNIIMKGR